jgi:hypothetical protein
VLNLYKEISQIYRLPKPKLVQHYTLNHNLVHALFSRLNQEEQS